MYMNSRHAPESDPRERGAILVTFALMIVMFFGFMALAVDSSHAFVERRNSQSVADVAVIGGALQTIANSGTKEQNLVNEVVRLVSVNLGIASWGSCNDTDPLPITWSGSLGGPSNCISWEPAFTTVRVTVPPRDIDTYFGGVIGVNSITVGAAAEAEIDSEGKSGVLPFGVLGNAPDSILCLKTGSGNGVPLDCEKNGTGNFHYIDFKTFGLGAIPTITECGQANKGERLKENIAHGVDHDLYKGHPDVSKNYLDADVCDGPPPVLYVQENPTDPEFAEYPMAFPWSGSSAALTETGTISGVVLEGLVQGVTIGGNSWPGRLAISGGKSYKGVPIDDEGLWKHLEPSALAACNADLIVAPDGAVDSEVEIIACIAFHASGGVPIFNTAALMGSVRYGWVPILHQTTWPPGTSAPVSFKAFQPMYIQTMFGGKCYADGTCDVSIIPGETWLGAGGKEPSALTAINIPSWAVSPTLRDPKDQVPRVLGYALSR
jgi:hypothetical protein